MGFDFSHLRIEEDSPEGRNLRAIIEREGVSPEEALRSALRGVPKHKPGPRPPNLEVAESLSIIGMWEGRDDLGAAIDAIVQSRPERYGLPR